MYDGGVLEYDAICEDRDLKFLFLYMCRFYVSCVKLPEWYVQYVQKERFNQKKAS